MGKFYFGFFAHPCQTQFQTYKVVAGSQSQKIWVPPKKVITRRNCYCLKCHPIVFVRLLLQILKRSFLNVKTEASHFHYIYRQELFNVCIFNFSNNFLVGPKCSSRQRPGRKCFSYDFQIIMKPMKFFKYEKYQFS